MTLLETFYPPFKLEYRIPLISYIPKSSYMVERYDNQTYCIYWINDDGVKVCDIIHASALR